MNCLIKAGQRSGMLHIPASKSLAHRMLISSALSGNESTLSYEGFSKDMEATLDCLEALGSNIVYLDRHSLKILPMEGRGNETIHLNCGESGSTLRFILPIAGALGAKAVFHMEGRLPMRPLDPLIDALTERGMSISKDGSLLHCEGQLTSGSFTIPGNVSSQFISGLLFALPLIEGDSTLIIEGKLESSAYVSMTENVLADYGIHVEETASGYSIPGGQKYVSPPHSSVEGDWSNAAFFLCMGAFSEKGVTVKGLSLDSSQGDKEILHILQRFGAEVITGNDSVTVKKNQLRGQIIDASEIPDLVPVISALASAAEGRTEIKGAGRLRFKESDRLKTTEEMLRALGADIHSTSEGLIIDGMPHLSGGHAYAYDDHRIAMAAAAAAVVCTGDVTIEGADCVSKSYPDFWDDFQSLEVKK